MSPRKPSDDWDWYDAPPKRPPPKRGIKVKKAGATWWGKRWIEALERMSSGYSSRLARGKTYARAGRVHDLSVSACKAAAKVTGSREPYDVRIELAPLGDAVWRDAIAAMAAKARFAAELLDGRMPDAIDDVFTQAGRSLFPVKSADLRTECSCPDWANPCKHVAAVHFVLGEAFDRDPFLLFELRGRTKAQVLEALRAAREDGAEGTAPRKRRRAADAGAKAAAGRAAKAVAAAVGGAVGAVGAVGDVAGDGDGDAGADSFAGLTTISLGRLKPEEYDTPRSPLPSLRFRFDPPEASAALLRQLGPPGAWSHPLTPAERLAPIVQAAAAAARRLALDAFEHAKEKTDEPRAGTEPEPGR